MVSNEPDTFSFPLFQSSAMKGHQFISHEGASVVAGKVPFFGL